jgi:hypothetical protein
MAVNVHTSIARRCAALQALRFPSGVPGSPQEARAASFSAPAAAHGKRSSSSWGGQEGGQEGGNGGGTGASKVASSGSGGGGGGGSSVDGSVGSGDGLALLPSAAELAAEAAALEERRVHDARREARALRAKRLMQQVRAFRTHPKLTPVRA